MEVAGVGHVYNAFAAGLHALRTLLSNLSKFSGYPPAFDESPELYIPMLDIFWGNAGPNGCFAGALVGAKLGYSAISAFSQKCLSKHKYRWLLDYAEGFGHLLVEPQAIHRRFPTTQYASKYPYPPAVLEKRDADHEAWLERKEKACQRRQKARTGNPIALLRFLFRL